MQFSDRCILDKLFLKNIFYFKVLKQKSR